MIELVQRGIRWTVGNGSNIAFWTFSWVLPFPLIYLIDDIRSANIDWNESVADYISNKVWNRDKLLTVLDMNIVDQICGIPIPKNNQADSFVWGFSPNGDFTVKFATWIQNNETKSHEFSPLIRKVWNSDLAPKIKIFSWLLLRGRLKAKSRLHSSDVAADFILRDDSGCPVLASAYKIGKTTVPIAEAIALMDSLLIDLEVGFQNVLIEGDSSLVINCVIGKFKCPWRLIQLIQDIKRLASSFQSISFWKLERLTSRPTCLPTLATRLQVLVVGSQAFLLL
ncbi:hypothetical protein ACLB2K_012987 [Fragaria x ananassa]